MKLSASAQQILGTVAETLATATLGPFAPLADAVIHGVLGSKDAPSAQAALLTANPDQLLALKKADNDFKVQIDALGIQKEQLAYADTASARGREEVVKDFTPRIIAYLVIFLVLIAEGSMFFIGQPKSIDGVVLGRILGTLDSALMLVLGYYFGSSAGSAKKDSTISDLAKSP